MIDRTRMPHRGWTAFGRAVGTLVIALGLSVVARAATPIAAGAASTPTTPTAAAPRAAAAPTTGTAPGAARSAEGTTASMTATLPAQAPEKFKVRFELSNGTVVAEFTKAWAPQGVQRFYELVREGYYNEARFFRVVPGFVVQFGLAADPAVTARWRDRRIPDDPVLQSNARGTISFASAGPNTRTTQLFINLVDNRRLDTMGFAPIGRVIEGMDIVDKINAEYREQPQQPRITAEGNAYLNRQFPRLDYIKTAQIILEP